MLTKDQFERAREWPRSARFELYFDLQLFGYQREFVDDVARKKAWNAARRSGKTTVAGAIPALAAIEDPGSESAVFAPSATQAKRMFEETKGYLETAVRGIEGLSLTKTNETEYRLNTGSKAYCATLGSETARGAGPSTICIDEVAHGVTEADVNRVVRPMTLTHDDYEIVLTSTPRGKSSFFYDATRAESAWSEHHATAFDNPLADRDELETLREELDSISFAMEYLAEFADDGSSYLPEALVDPCVSGDVLAARGRTWLLVDPARHGSDRSAYLAIDERGVVFHTETVDRESTPMTMDKIRALNERFAPDAVLVDASSGASDEAVAEFDHARPMKFSTKRKQDYYQTLRRLLEARRLTLPADSDLADELTDLAFDFTVDGLLRVHARPNSRDDLADACALAAYALDRDLVVNRSYCGTQAQLHSSA
jgi:hypothetical protein